MNQLLSVRFIRLCLLDTVTMTGQPHEPIIECAFYQTVSAWHRHNDRSATRTNYWVCVLSDCVGLTLSPWQVSHTNQLLSVRFIRLCRLDTVTMTGQPHEPIIESAFYQTVSAWHHHHDRSATWTNYWVCVLSDCVGSTPSPWQVSHTNQLLSVRFIRLCRLDAVTMTGQPHEPIIECAFYQTVSAWRCHHDRSASWTNYWVCVLSDCVRSRKPILVRTTASRLKAW